MATRRRCCRRRRTAWRGRCRVRARWSRPASVSCLPRPWPGEVGVDGDHVDLAEGRRRGRRLAMDLGPAEPGEPAVALVETEPVGIEPRLAARGRSDHVERPAALLVVIGEGPVVHREEGVLVDARHERSGDDRHRQVRWAAAAASGAARGRRSKPSAASTLPAGVAVAPPGDLGRSASRGRAVVEQVECVVDERRRARRRTAA